MKRALIACVGLLAAVALFVVGTGASSDDSGAYKVRAIFDNAFTVIPGLDVKSAGVKVGQVEALDVTADQKAAVVLRIDDPAFQDFRTDARCTIRPQGLIGEKFVECDPTQPRREGEAPPPELTVVAAGEDGAGQRLLPVEQTGKPVDLDLVNSALKLPYRQRLSLIINELGTAVAGRGGELQSAIRRLDPAFMETGKVLKILADQNDVLEDLAVQSDAALAPLARDRESVERFVESADRAARSQAEVRPEFEQTLKRLPTFLGELRPTMKRLDALAEAGIPVASDLRASAPALSRFLVGTGPFAAASTTAVQSLGETAETGGKAVIASKETIERLGTLASEGKPVAANLRALTESAQERGVFERLLTAVFYAANSQNGFDDIGYYQRLQVLAENCAATYTVERDTCAYGLGRNLKEPFTAGVGVRPDASASNASAAKASASRSTAKAAAKANAPGLPLAMPFEVGGESKPASKPKASKTSETSSSAAALAEDQVADYLLGGGQ